MGKVFGRLVRYVHTSYGICLHTHKKKKGSRGGVEAVNLCCKSYSVVPALCSLTGIMCGGTLLLPPMAGPSFQSPASHSGAAAGRIL